MFNKILIANRGEIALRVIRACRELGVKTVAVYSEADRDALHVKFADEAVCIGPPPSRESYLNIPRIIAAAEITNADAIHPGYGFLAENAHFAEICLSSGLQFIGPRPESIESMGDKSLAKATMRKAGVSVIPGSDGNVADAAAARRIVDEIGYPIMIKAAAGGGGKGMRAVTSAEELERAYEIARSEAGSAFGNPDVYIERLVEQPRHVEIQVLGDRHGNVIHLGERDCTIQRRHQKLIEESPSPVVTHELREQMGAAAVAAAKAVNYEGAGTVEFLLDANRHFYFMEMNTRIQVEHPVTEMVAGLDLIRAQIEVAAGEKLQKRKLKPRGHAIECRINAEDPANNFRPSPGRLTSFHVPGGYGVRVDTAAYVGYEIPPYYDSLLAKLIVWGETRDVAIRKMVVALDEFIVEGVHTTIPFHEKVFLNERFRSGLYDTSFVDSLDHEA
ncbi:MAG: acetyl-CoA carboxylase biotin carboxylase subunit [Ignavibacteriales bacterium CG07_land_8_20_14_0_80_59_12]|nr:MAG: acetyl-CoA carboxylase biotin carboxylase subunit [Ignavibacteriales bacterium CG07_land_8_20_14_0_80_59_12]